MLLHSVSYSWFHPFSSWMRHYLFGISFQYCELSGTEHMICYFLLMLTATNFTLSFSSWHDIQVVLHTVLPTF